MIPEILASYSLSLAYLRELVSDVEEDEFAAQRYGAVNHPAWVIGHLIYSAQAIGGEIGLTPWLPADWERQFGTGSIPAGDSLAYPSKASLLHMLDDAEHRLREQLRSVGEEVLKEPLPDVRYREIFPTRGHAVLHILGAHTAVHVGQLTVWRRVVGLGPIEKKFV